MLHATQFPRFKSYRPDEANRSPTSSFCYLEIRNFFQRAFNNHLSEANHLAMWRLMESPFAQGNILGCSHRPLHSEL